jgi:hypothetical protein
LFAARYILVRLAAHGLQYDPVPDFLMPRVKWSAGLSSEQSEQIGIKNQG